MDFIINYYLLHNKGPLGTYNFQFTSTLCDVCKNLKANNRKQTFKTHRGEKKSYHKPVGKKIHKRNQTRTKRNEEDTSKAPPS